MGEGNGMDGTCGEAVFYALSMVLKPLTEGRNTGLGKILRALEKNGSSKPLFETDDERTSFVATIFIRPNFVASGNDFGNNNGNENQNDNEDRILNAMKEVPHVTIDVCITSYEEDW